MASTTIDAAFDEAINTLVNEIQETYASQSPKYSECFHSERTTARTRLLGKISKIVKTKACSQRADDSDIAALTLFVKVANETAQALNSIEKHASSDQNHLKPTLCALFGSIDGFRSFHEDLKHELKCAKQNGTTCLLNGEYYEHLLDHYNESIFNYLGAGGCDGPKYKAPCIQPFGAAEYGKQELKDTPETHATSNLIVFVANQGRKIQNLERALAQQQEYTRSLETHIKKMQSQMAEHNAMREQLENLKEIVERHFKEELDGMGDSSRMKNTKNTKNTKNAKQSKTGKTGKAAKHKRFLIL